MNKSRVWVSLGIVFNFLVLGNGGLAAENSAQKGAGSRALEIAKELNEAFIEVTDRVSPAVVVISVVQKAGVGDMEDEESSLWDMLPPDLRRRFFEERGQGQGQGRERGQRPPRRPSRPMEGRGSGFVISEDGYILTNNHVVEDAEKITVRFKDSKEFPAEIKGRDPQSDLAVIKIKAKGLVPVKLGDSSATRVGEFVIAVGAPFDLDYSVTVGHVSAKGRSFERAFGGYLDQDFIQTDASINPGNSGGPLVNLYGDVIGINSMIRGLNTGIGFAIPSNLAKTVMNHLISEGRFVRSWVGVGIAGLREDQEYKGWVPNVEDGVVIRSIVARGPASKSELRLGDVVTAVDGKTVKTSRELKETISAKPVGSAITLDVLREDRSRNWKAVKVKIKTEALPNADEETPVGTRRKAAEPDATTSFGLTVKPLTRELADQFNLEEKLSEKQGLIVTDVEAGSAAEQKGIRPGDVITEVNRVPVGSLKQYRDALKGADPKRGVVMNFMSNGESRFAVLKDSGE